MSKEKKREMMIKRDDTAFDRILAHHSNPEAFPLTNIEKEQLSRWHECFTLMLNHWSKPKIVLKWKNDKDLSPAQAYADIRNAESLFGNVFKADREAYRAKWMLWAEDYLTRSIQKGDLKSQAKALDLIGKYGGLAVEDNPSFNPEKLKHYKIEFDLPKALVEIMQDMADKGVHDFNGLDVTDIPFEEIKKEGDEQ